MHKKLLFHLRALAQSSVLSAMGTLPLTLTPPAGTVVSLLLGGNTEVTSGKLRSVGDGGTLSLTLTDAAGIAQTVSLSLPMSLGAVSDVRDTLSLTDGVLTRRTAYVSLHEQAASVESLGAVRNVSVFRLPLPDAPLLSGDACISSHLTPFIGPSAMYGSSFGCAIFDGVLWFTLDGIMTPEEAGVYLADHDIGVLYTRAEEQTLHITPQVLHGTIAMISAAGTPKPDAHVRYLAAGGR